ncbi:11391_t:CDS:10 [Funneliformis caledonium]|uniref:11391_t:CDS:1 n=1 Tax=Funneliformis caledonium TaxID=1117310 RepID=A0A9N9GBV0_9GLOM|nr:11391_t:CDS:10 [Funneliformis caledonium]
MLRSNEGLCGSGVWGPITEDGLELTPCAREVNLTDILFSILNAAIPICIIILSITNLIVRRCRGRTTSRSYYAPLPGNDPGASPNESGNIPVSKYDIAQIIISFFHLGFIGFLFGWRMDDEGYTGLYLVIGAIGQFFSWTQHAYLRHLLLFYAYFVIVAFINLRSMLKHEPKGYELVFSIWNAIACSILLACSLKRPRNPELKYARDRVISHDTIASLWSLLSFAWMTPIIKLGNRRVLTEEDLWELPSRCQSAQCYHELERITNMDLLSRLLVANATNLVFFLIIAIFRSIFAFTTPLFLYHLLKYLSSADRSQQYSEEPYLYVFGILISELFRIVFLNQLNYQVVWLGIRVEQMLSVLIYEKQLRLKTSPRAASNKPNNVLTADVDDIAGFFSNLPFIITIPLEILAAMVFLFRLLGWPSLVGVGVMILCLWSNKRFGRRVTRLQKRVKKARDDRVGEIFELLHAVRMIKMFAWESSFHERLMLSRKRELTYLRSLFWRTTMLTLLVHLTPFLVTLFAFASFTYFKIKDNEDYPLTAAIAFTSITLFNTLKQPLQIFPNLVVELVSLGVAIGRVEKFLHEPDVQREGSGFSINPTRTSVGFNNVDVAWNYHINVRDHNEFILKGVNLEFPLEKLSIVCGQKSSGKSLLLLSLLRETFILRGKILFPSSSITYVPQQAWLENTTFRDNILFGEPFNDERYWRIVDSCCLTNDFENFDQADFTEYDEKNMVLSDGQKVRVALARALYTRQIINNCLKGPLVHGRTVIMVTHYVRYFVDNAAYIVILGDSLVQAKGTPQELREAGSLTEEVLGKEIKPEPEHIDKNDQNLVNQAIEKSVADKKNWAVEEARFQGKIQPGVYYFYFKSSGGIILWFSLIILFIIIRLLTVGETYWLKEWSEADDKPEKYYIQIYALIALASAIFTIIRMAWQFFFVSLKGSKTLFSKLLNAILRAPLSFFDTAPLGRVMNRFSKDLGMIDQGLVTVISSFIGNAIGAISVLVVVTVVTREFFFVSIVVIILYLIIGSMYINVSRELKRLQSITRSPVLSWYTETITGITTIRAFKAEQRYVKKFIERLNTSNRTTYLLHMSNRWMSIRMGCIGAFASYLAGIFILRHYDRIDAGLAGFCLSYALGFVQIVFMLVKDYTIMETSLSSVERIKEYIEMPQEPPAVIDNAHPPAAWPTNGKIEVSNLTVQYSPQFEPVLRDISFTVNEEEKVGIVGSYKCRTGSGKTTLANSFLRLTEATEGYIIIDGIDISNLGLEDLRSRLTIISQDPILFEGTVRSNLDIRCEYDDQDLWEALRRVHLVHFEESLANDQVFVVGPITSLEDPVNEGGNNFSRGQRQLLCLARALLRQSKIIIMDEATASIDPETENKIQETIKNEFTNATVLCISHRFKTIIDSDRILVLNEGEIVEFDTPYRLINNMDSLFRHLCEQTGELETLMELARLNNPEEEEMVSVGEDDEELLEMESDETEEDVLEDQHESEHESGHEVEEEREEQEDREEPEINAIDNDKDDREVL